MICARLLMASVLVCAAALSWPLHANAAEEDVLEASETHILAGWLLDIPGQQPKRNQTIVVRGGRIVEVRAGFAASPSGATTIDLRDAHVLPGLIDCHVHLTAQMKEAELGPEDRLQVVTLSAADRALDGVVFARLTLRAGFTTVRDLGAEPGALFSLRNAIEAGKIPGPRIIAAGAALSATGGDGDINGFRAELLFPSQNICDGADDCRRAVRQQIKLGADVIKVIVAGGALAPGDDHNQFVSDDELMEIVRTAHELGRKVAAHAHSAKGIKAALRAGVDSVEHGTHVDDEALASFATHGTYLVPTLLAGPTFSEVAAKHVELPAPIREQAVKLGERMSAAVGRAHRAGVKIAFGSDAGAARHGENAREFQLMVAAGMPAMDTIRAATIDAAQLLGVANDIGTLEVGKAADVVAFRADPLADVRNLMKPIFVMRSGVIYRCERESSRGC